MISNYIHGLGIVLVALVFASCGSVSESNSSQPDKVMVFAAASLTDVLEELIDTFEVYNKVSVITNLASSGTLARQIEHGAEPDIYISASKKWADYIQELGLFADSLRVSVAQNELVLIAPKSVNNPGLTIDSLLNFLSLLNNGRLSVGDPNHVPAGKYAKQSLTYFGWFTQLNGKILPAKDVRSALRVVELGETPLGIVYKTDALKSTKVSILGTFPENSHDHILYVAGMCKLNEASTKFYLYLNSAKANPIWEKYGFTK